MIEAAERRANDAARATGDTRRWAGGGVTQPVPVDIGSTTITGLRGRLGGLRGDKFGHPVLCTRPIDAGVAASLGSDFHRTGLLFDPPVFEDQVFVDGYGVHWLWADGEPAYCAHPLETASLGEIARHPRPVWPGCVQNFQGAGWSILDAPCPGLLETCFALRNGWQFMVDLTDNWRAANALLDWALECVVSAYEAALSQLVRPPDLILYGDDYGYLGGMFVSPVDFQQFVKPRLQTLLARLRRLSPSPVLFHSCGAIGPLLDDIVALGVDALSLDPMAKGMVLPEVRPALPAGVVLHGPVDLVALGQALMAGDMKSIAILATELAACAPAIAAPIDSLNRPEEVRACRWAARFVRALDEEDWSRLRKLGPVKSILEHGLSATRTGDSDALPVELPADSPTLVR